MNRVLPLVILTFVLLLTSSSAHSQEEQACDVTAFSETLTQFATDLATTEDTDTFLLDVQREIANFRAGCNGLAWNSEAEGLNPVIGPVTIPAGIYRATVDSTDTIAVEITVIDGDCDDPYWGFIREEAQGAQEIYEAETDCEILLNVQNASEAWTITFERLG